MYLLTMSFDERQVLIVTPTAREAVDAMKGWHDGRISIARQMKPDHWFGNFFDSKTAWYKHHGKSARYDRLGTYTIQPITSPVIVFSLAHGEMEYAWGDEVLVFIDEHDPAHPVWVRGEVVGTECVFGEHCYVIELQDPHFGLVDFDVWRFSHEIKKGV